MTLAMAATFLALNVTAFGQQTPAQRYQPVRESAFRTAPPSVHVAPSQIQRLSAQNGQRTTGTSFNFSDNARRQAAQQRSARPARPGFEAPKSNYSAPRSPIQQTSFQSDRNQEPSVPAILSGKQPQKRLPTPKYQTPNAPQFPASIPTADEKQTMAAKSPADFASTMTQAGSTLPRVSPEELAQANDISAQMTEIRRRAQAKKHPAMQASKIGSNQLQSGAHQTAPVGHTEAIGAAGLPVAEAVAAAKESSASDFIGNISGETDQAAPSAPSQDSLTAPKLVAKQDSDSPSEPAVMQLTNKTENVSTPLRETQVYTAAPVNDQSATIKLAAPAIDVETFGPQSIGINKPATYQVVVRNNSASSAERILVGVNIPQWVDIENVNMTTGGKEVTDGTQQARLVWSIDQIPGNGSQTITITAVPTKAEPFDVGVEWTLVPRVGKASVTVTEPKLEMTISGPTEVLYGETANYDVTVRNPGTGDAENVTVMLPESLGGERESLGPIEAGKEKHFAVELLARTAGELSLVATAVGDGNLKASAERVLTVRRAILGISLKGPGLKYSGSVAKYQVQVSNSGDAAATEVVSAVALPPGVKYLSGIESVKLIEGGMKWTVGSLDPGQTRTYDIHCQLDTSGDLQLEVGARGKGDLAASSACLTTVETVADLVLMVADPKGPLPTGENIPYEIKVQNRGSRSAKGVNLVMQFSEGIEPKSASGLKHQIVPGQVLFSPIEEIEPGQEVSFKVTAAAMKSGTHIFRAQLTCEESDSREIAEGTTRFFGENVQPTTTAKATDDANSFRPPSGTEIK